MHLVRDPEATARSFLKRADRGILLAYRTQILMGAPRRNPGAGDLEFCRDYVGTVTANIRAFLRDKPRTMVVRLEEVATDFPRFWDWIGAEGDAVAAQAEWEVRHNASP